VRTIQQNRAVFLSAECSHLSEQRHKLRRSIFTSPPKAETGGYLNLKYLYQQEKSLVLNLKLLVDFKVKNGAKK